MTVSAWGALPEVYRFLGDGQPIQPAAFAQLHALNRQPPSGLWLIELASHGPIGAVWLAPHAQENALEINYLVHPDHWGKGCAVTACGRLLQTLFARNPNLSAVIAGADADNTASFAVMRRLGMQFYRRVSYPLGSGEEWVLHNDSKNQTMTGSPAED